MDNSKKFLLMLNKAIKQNPEDFKNFDKTKNVQSQLQEMGIKEEYEVDMFGQLSMLNYFIGFNCSCYRNPKAIRCTSMEQLWLAFVMEEKYSKCWSRKKWVESNVYTHKEE